MDYNPFLVLVIASFGNCTGVTINYFLGKNGINFILNKRKILGDDKLDYYNEKFKKYNNAIFLLAWLPIIGDPITIYAGIIKLKFSEFALYVYTTRILRYIVLYYFIETNFN